MIKDLNQLVDEIKRKRFVLNPYTKIKHKHIKTTLISDKEYYKYHQEAKTKFGGNHKCQVCGKSNREEWKELKHHLSIHCTSVPKNYALMTPENWIIVCGKCHWELEFVKHVEFFLCGKSDSKNLEKEPSYEDIMEKIEQDREDYYQIDYKKLLKKLSAENLR